MVDIAAYAGLFLTGLVAATILPMQSEVARVALLLAVYSPWFSCTGTVVLQQGGPRTHRGGGVQPPINP